MEDFEVNWDNEDESQFIFEQEPTQLTFEGIEAQEDVASIDIPDEPSPSIVDSISAAAQYRCGRLFG